MKKRIPISVAKRLAKELGQSIVVLVSFEDDISHVVTYGKSLEDSKKAATLGNDIKRQLLGWPTSECQAVPARVVRAMKKKCWAVLDVDTPGCQLLEYCDLKKGHKELHRAKNGTTWE